VVWKEFGEKERVENVGAADVTFEKVEIEPFFHVFKQSVLDLVQKTKVMMTMGADLSWNIEEMGKEGWKGCELVLEGIEEEGSHFGRSSRY
jgi:hypothetical protein